MTRFRPFWVASILVVSIVLAFLLRDALYHLVIVPLAYVLWLVRIYYSAIPQVLLWILLVVVLFMTSLPNFLPELRWSQRREEKYRRTRGQIETLAGWIVKARRGTYFKWQIANRLGRLARGLNGLSGQRDGRGLPVSARTGEESSGSKVERYLDAGLNTSFVDYPRAGRFQQRVPTALDLDPQEAVSYLESQMELSRGRHP